MERKNELLIRVYLVFLAFVVFAFMILGRVIKITLVEGDKWREKAGKNVKRIETHADRGNIYDINGNLLATSLPFFDIKMDMMVPKKELFDSNLDSLSILLSRHFSVDKTPAEWRMNLSNARKKKNRYFSITKNITLDQLQLLKTFPILRNGQYGGGLIVERYGRREKPFKSMAARTIGVDRENAVKIGIEDAYDRFLKGPSETMLMKRLPQGVWIPMYDPTEVAAKKGNDVITTLDMRMQDIVHDELNRVLLEQQAFAGTAVLMEVATGEIKAISNLGQTGKGYYDEDYNYAVGRLSEPGSSCKMASVLALLEDGFMDIDDPVDLRGGKRKFYDQWMYDSEMHGKTNSTLREAFEISSNVGIAGAVFQYYGKGKDNWQQFANRLRDFGYYEKTTIDIVGEKAPFVKDPSKSKEWWGTTVPWMAHGYELMQTPLQTLAFYNAIANDGDLMKPFLVKEIMGDGVVLKAFKPKVLKSKIAKIENLRKCQELLKGVVERGTGRRIKSDVCSFSGKTGTTRVNYSSKDEVKKYNASFVGYFPSDKPKYSLIVMVYEPKKQFYGAQVAGPAFKNIVERVYSIKDEYVHDKGDDSLSVELALNSKHSGFKEDYTQLMGFIGMNISKSDNARWVNVDSEGPEVFINKKKILKSKVPDVRGMGLRDATYVLENLGLDVVVKGVGKVSRQSVSAGTNIRGQKIEIFLN